MTKDPLDVDIPFTLTFKSHREEREWCDQRVPAILRDILEDASSYGVKEFGWIPCITSIFRTPEENEEAGATTTIHCVWRAIDVRTRNIHPEIVEAVTKYTNERWMYDANRPSKPVAFSKPHGNGPHIHFQVHQNTARRKPKIETA